MAGLRVLLCLLALLVSLCAAPPLLASALRLRRWSGGDGASLDASEGDSAAEEESDLLAPSVFIESSARGRWRDTPPAAPAMATPLPFSPPAAVAVQSAPVATDPSGLPPISPSSAGGEDSSEVGMCEVCMYVMENKMQHQPYLCKGLTDPHQQNLCVQVMESLMWWISNEVYWINYGCQMNQNGAISWVRPCPSHATCSWLQHLYLRKPYCTPDPNFPKPA